MVTVVCGKEVTVIECAIGGLPKCPKFTCSGHTFRGCWLLLCVCVCVVTVVCGKEVTVIECAIGGLPKCPKFIRMGDTF